MVNASCVEDDHFVATCERGSLRREAHFVDFFRIWRNPPAHSGISPSFSSRGSLRRLLPHLEEPSGALRNLAVLLVERLTSSTSSASGGTLRRTQESRRPPRRE